jgi:hypothetical protein
MYNTYAVNNFTCTVGPLTFSMFKPGEYSNAKELGGNDITDANVEVSPFSELAKQRFGLLFSLGAGMAVRGTDAVKTGTAQFVYKVSGPPIALAEILLNGNRDGTGTDATLSKSVSGTQLDVSVASGDLDDSELLPGAPTMVDVSETGTVEVPGGPLQQAQIQSIRDTFVLVPEPATAVTLLAGTFSLFVVVRLRRHVRST